MPPPAQISVVILRRQIATSIRFNVPEVTAKMLDPSELNVMKSPSATAPCAVPGSRGMVNASWSMITGSAAAAVVGGAVVAVVDPVGINSDGDVSMVVSMVGV